MLVSSAVDCNSFHRPVRKSEISSAAITLHLLVNIDTAKTKKLPLTLHTFLAHVGQVFRADTLNNVND